MRNVWLAIGGLFAVCACRSPAASGEWTPPDTLFTTPVTALNWSQGDCHDFSARNHAARYQAIRTCWIPPVILPEEERGDYEIEFPVHNQHNGIAHHRYIRVRRFGQDFRALVCDIDWGSGDVTGNATIAASFSGRLLEEFAACPLLDGRTEHVRHLQIKRIAVDFGRSVENLEFFQSILVEER